MKKIIFSVMLLVLTISMASCGSQAIQIAWFTDGSEGAVMQELLDMYEEETGVEFELVEIPYDDYETRLATMVTGGDAPALARVTEGNLNNFQDNILSLEGVYNADGYKNKFYNGDGDVISLPMDLTANGLFVNTTLLDANSIDYDLSDEGGTWTWDTFYTRMSVLNGVAGVEAPGFIDNRGHRLMPTIVYQAGTIIWETPYTDSNLTDAAVVAQLERIMGYYEEGFLADEVYSEASAGAAAMFRSGQYGFQFSGNWNVSSYSDADNPLSFDWTVVPMPTDSEGNGGSILGGKSMAAFKESGHEEEAKAFLTWLAAAEHHDYFTNGAKFLTPRVGATVDFGDVADIYDVFQAEIDNTSLAANEDWFNMVMIPGMYPIINDFAEKVALRTDGTTPYTALGLLQDLETDLKAAAAGE